MSKDSNYYSITNQLITLLKDSDIVPCEIEPHDLNNQESWDSVWLKKYTDGGMSEGEYLKISPSFPNSDDWYIAHNAADVCGGHPTFWSKSGTTEELLPTLFEYFKSRYHQLN